MKRLDYNHILIFHELIKTRSISDTANLLGTSVAKISRDIKLLEQSLGAILFVRKKNGLALTPSGEFLEEETSYLVDTNKKVLNYFIGKEDASQKVLDLNVITTKGYSGYCATKLLKSFLKENRDISLKLFTTESDINEAHFFGDISIASQRILSQEFGEIKINEPLVKFVASDEYIKRKGAPTNLEDLKNHDMISYNFSFYGNRQHVDWFVKKLSIKSKFRINNLFSIFDFVKNGFGIGFIPEKFANEHSDNIKIFDHLPSHSFPQYLTFKKRSLEKEPVKRFIDFIKKNMP